MNGGLEQGPISRGQLGDELSVQTLTGGEPALDPIEIEAVEEPCENGEEADGQHEPGGDENRRHAAHGATAVPGIGRSGNMSLGSDSGVVEEDEGLSLRDHCLECLMHR